MTTRAVAASLLALSSLVSLAPATASADDWAKYRGDCDDVLRSHSTQVLLKLKECVSLWTAYVEPNALKPNQRQEVKNAFQTLYDKGVQSKDEEAQYFAVQAADRLGESLKLDNVKPPSAPSKGTGSEKAAPPEAKAKPARKKFVAPEVSKPNQKKAADLVKDGVGHFKKGKRDKALKAYEQALEADPANVNALYNHAAEMAFRKKKKECIESLTKLFDLGTKESMERLRNSRVDPDFAPMHDEVAFKEVSGYAKIKLVNSLGELGEDEIKRIEKLLGELKFKVVETGDDKTKGRQNPVVFFKDHSAASAYIVKLAVVHPGTVVTKITWESDFDIIVSWGNKIVVKDGVKMPAKDYTDTKPADVEKQVQNLRAAEDKALREPKQAAYKVKNAVETPQRVKADAERGVNEVKSTIDTMKKTGDAIKKAPDIFKLK